MKTAPKGNHARLRIFREHLGISQKAMGEALGGLKQRTYAHYEVNPDSTIPSELIPLLADLGLNVHWLYTGTGPMLKKDMGTAQALNQVVREPAAEYDVDGQTQIEAETLVDEMVIQGRPYDPPVRSEWVMLVAEEIAELRALGRPGDIRRKIRRLVRIADGHVGGQSKK